MKLKKLLFASAMSLAVCGILQAQNTQVIAHRGFWKTDGSAQNSIAALVKADSIHCYGSEFDVWLTADNKLIVDHDGVFKGVRMETSTEKECTSITLDNGENLPTLQQYLDKAKGLRRWDWKNVPNTSLSHAMRPKNSFAWLLKVLPYIIWKVTSIRKN